MYETYAGSVAIASLWFPWLGTLSDLTGAHKNPSVHKTESELPNATIAYMEDRFSVDTRTMWYAEAKLRQQMVAAKECMVRFRSSPELDGGALTEKFMIELARAVESHGDEARVAFAECVRRETPKHAAVARDTRL